MHKFYFKNSVLVIFFLSLISLKLCSQSIGVGTSTPNISAALDITSSVKGLLIPRMTSAAITTISKPAKGLMVYDSVVNQLMVNMGSSNSPNWQNIASNNSWGLTGNANTDTAINFIGTTDSIPLYFKINNQPSGSLDSIGYTNTSVLDGNTFLGYGSGRHLTTGVLNSAFGYQAMDSNSIGSNNTAFGAQALNVNVLDGAIYNTAVGYQAMTKGINPDDLEYGTGTGYQAGNGSSALGYQALGIGYGSAYGGYGAKSQGVGYAALYSNHSVDNSSGIYGFDNTGYGFQALYSNVSGSNNVGFGVGAMYLNDFGTESFTGDASDNTAVGAYSLFGTLHSQGNVALGYNAGRTYDNGYYNCFIGSETDANGPQYYNTIALGHGTLVTAPSMMRVGNGATTSIGGQVQWSVVSDGRVKKNIQENVTGLAFINKLKPVTYTIDLEAIDRIVRPSNQNAAAVSSSDIQSHTTTEKIDGRMAAARKAKEEIVYSGFVAQDVERAAKSVNYDFSGVDAPRNDKDLYGLRYANFVVPLVKAMQELAQQYDELKTENEKLIQQKEQMLQQLQELEIKAR
jgi:trimeric autotransporter adhesin